MPAAAEDPVPMQIPKKPGFPIQENILTFFPVVLDKPRGAW
jgi:hypothetical protein